MTTALAGIVATVASGAAIYEAFKLPIKKGASELLEALKLKYRNPDTLKKSDYAHVKYVQGLPVVEEHRRVMSKKGGYCFLDITEKNGVPDTIRYKTEKRENTAIWYISHFLQLHKPQRIHFPHLVRWDEKQVREIQTQLPPYIQLIKATYGLKC